MVKRILLSLIVSVAWGAGCGEPPDELTPYMDQLVQMQKHNETLARYEVYLHNPGLERQARDVREILQAYREEMEGFGKTKDKFIRAGHNNVKRALDRGLKQIVEPDFPTFMVSASKQIRNIRGSVEGNFENLEKMWVEAGKTEPFPLKWPVPGE